MRTGRFVLAFSTTLLVAASPAIAQWTPLPAGPGAQIVYVSSSGGTDANNGLSEATAKATIAAGYALLRNGQGDHLLLKRGDIFAVSSSLLWTKSGASAQYPMVLSAYGSGARPVIDPGGSEAFHITPGFRSPNTVRHLAVAGLHFRAAQRDFTQPGFNIATVTSFPVAIRVVGVQTTAPQIVEDLLIEGCKFEFMGQPLVLEGPYADSVRDVRVRRNVLADTYNTTGHTNGAFVSNVRGLLMEENLIDGVQRAPGLDAELATSSMSHAVYGQSTSRDLTLRNNIFARAFDGSMMRPGGTYEGNVVADVMIGTHQGFMFSPSAPIITEGVDARVIGNAFLKLGANQGIQAGNLRTGVIRDNLMLSGASTGGTGITLIGSTALGQVGVRDLVVDGNFVLGLRALTAYGNAISNVAVRNNQLRASNSSIVDLLDYQSGDFVFAGNAYRSEALPGRWFSINQRTFYDLAGWTVFIGEAGATNASSMNPASAPDVESYHATIGGAPTLAAFLNEARQQSSQSWRDAYTAGRVLAYLRQQLGQSPAPLSPSLVVRLNATTFRAGDQMILTAVFSAGSAPAVVDAYIVVRLPDGQFLSMVSGGQVSPGLVPFMRNFTSFDNTAEVFRYPLNGGEPPGSYTWMSALVERGTLNVVGPLTQVAFTVTR